jgi:hypothetical protein
MPHTPPHYDLRRVRFFAWTDGRSPLDCAPLLIWVGFRFALDFWYLYQRTQSTLGDCSKCALSVIFPLCYIFDQDGIWLLLWFLLGEVNSMSDVKAAIQHEIDLTNATKAQLLARKQALEKRKEFAESSQARKHDTRRKVLIGSVLEIEAKTNEEVKKLIDAALDKHLKRKMDRQLFGLEGGEESKKKAAKPPKNRFLDFSREQP